MNFVVINGKIVEKDKVVDFMSRKNKKRNKKRNRNLDRNQRVAPMQFYQVVGGGETTLLNTKDGWVPSGELVGDGKEDGIPVYLDRDMEQGNWAWKGDLHKNATSRNDDDLYEAYLNGRTKYSGKNMDSDSSYWNRPAITPCHTGNKFAFDYKNIKFYGGGFMKNYEPTKADLVIDVGHVTTYNEMLVTVSNMDRRLGIEQFEPPTIRLDWTDSFAFKGGKDFWKTLVNDVKNLAGSSGKAEFRVLVCCQGGHGRTGTTLSILYYYLRGSITPVEDLRKVYCEEMVETEGQIEYIREITGLKNLGSEPTWKNLGSGW